MKIAVAGKGGVGKTTVSGTVARALARRGHAVLALDADVNPMLGVSLGVGAEQTDLLLAARQAVAAGDAEHEPTIEGIVERFGADAPDGVRLVVASRLEVINPGCQCCGVNPQNLVRDDSDIELMRGVLGDCELVVIPEDPVIVAADRQGSAPIDLDAGGPGVAALVRLADRLAGAPVLA
jgi:MinD superfamily P-loop ATPase